MKNWFNRLLAAIAFMLLAGSTAFAQTNIEEVTTAVNGYVGSAIGVGVAVLLFVLGRKVIRKLI